MRTLTSWDSLQPLVGTTSESADLDFKETLDPSQGKIEFAKDIAAFANWLGGHVLVGVSTDMNRTRCTGFHGIETELATKITKVIEEQVKDRCRPTPIFDVRSIGREGTSKVVVVVAVWASPHAPVGVCLRQEKGGLLVDKGWAFPYRVGSLTEYLHPDQFGVYESMSARRSAAILSSIPTNEREQVNLRWGVRATVPGSGYGDGQTVHLESVMVRFRCVDLLGNVASFRELNGDAPIDVPRVEWGRADRRSARPDPHRLAEN
ncbi:MAG: ATP-binding protein [Planctomycetia bacterium]|nr:ATP-binding protein [Planctomycetia bacterium]